MAEIFLVNGEGGVGKTTLVEYFLKHPLKDVVFFDFDKGKYELPKESSLWKEWKDKQQRWWLTFFKEYVVKHPERHIVLCGVVAFPWKLELMDEYKELENAHFHFAFLTCSDEERKRRLEERGDGHLWKPKAENILEIEERMRGLGAREIETSIKTVEEVAKDVSSWILGSATRL